MKKIISLLILLFIISINESKASHILGGEVYYECTGVQGTNRKYTVTAIMYKDCGPTSANFLNINLKAVKLGPSPSTVWTFNKSIDIIEDIDFSEVDDCVEFPTVCVQKGSYIIEDVLLPTSSHGILLSYSSGTLSSQITNIQTPNSINFACVTKIPKTSFNSCDDSPRFNNPPPTFFCEYANSVADLSVTDSTGDDSGEGAFAFRYNYHHPLRNDNGLPPYLNTMPFVTGYTAAYPIGSNPQMNHNTLTGLWQGTPTEIGKFMAGTTAYQIDANNDTVGYVQRVYRYLVADCNINVAIPGVVGGIEAISCGDTIVNFANNSINAENYTWIFDDGDSTSIEAPVHTFPGFGTYHVKLISYSDNIHCNDTTILPIVLEAPVESVININEPTQCLSRNNFNFNAITTSGQSSLTYVWDFGPAATNPSMTGKYISGISFNQAGTHQITLTTIYKECQTQTFAEITITEDDLAQITGPEFSCLPNEVTFSPSVINPNYEYTWYIDGQIFKQQEVSYYFSENKIGTFDIRLQVLDKSNGCSSEDFEPNYITTYKVPEVEYNISDTKISLEETVEIETGEDYGYDIKYKIIPPTGSNQPIHTFDTALTFEYTFLSEGDYQIIQTATNVYCESENLKIVNVGPRIVSPPNAFSPNGDKTNDFFVIEPYNNTNIILSIYDRWGNKVFRNDHYETCTEQNSANCWDGNSENGEFLESGTYYYVIELQNGYKRRGTVALFR
ncbi:MAG: gliding motility-associated C-terminal domain-containing protein [Flavobacteriales bacterium]|jgi:gliding motility-associated-like protein|nr:gliding motility-associated C-terminal domain-containing protein [Flavobacteriales bacterium]